jgi:hypothetical protein
MTKWQNDKMTKWQKRQNDKMTTHSTSVQVFNGREAWLSNITNVFVFLNCFSKNFSKTLVLSTTIQRNLTNEWDSAEILSLAELTTDHLWYDVLIQN